MTERKNSSSEENLVGVARSIEGSGSGGFELHFGKAERSVDFKSRCKDVFGELGTVTREVPAEDKGAKRSRSSTAKWTQDYKNQESIFRLPEGEESGWPPKSGKGIVRGNLRTLRREGCGRPRGKRQPPSKVPDHVLNPQKYTKYSLTDAPSMTDRSNTRAALDFLDGLRKSKDEKATTEEIIDGSVGVHPVFKRPQLERGGVSRSGPAAAVSSSSFGFQGKRVLPETVVGQGRPVKKKLSSPKELKEQSGLKTGNVAISHLTYDDEDEDV